MAQQNQRTGFLLGRFAIAAAILLTLVAAAQAAGVHRIGPGLERLELSNVVGILPDPAGDLTAQQVMALAEQGAMKEVADPKSPVLRIHSSNVFWLKVDLATEPAASQSWRLVIGPPLPDQVQLFMREQDGSWTGSRPAGAHLPLSARPMVHRGVVFPLQLAPGQAKSLLLRVEDTGARRIRIVLWEPEALATADQTVIGWYSLYFGLLGGMVLYNLLLYVVARDRRFLLYVGFISGLGTALAASSGLGMQFVWGDWPWWNNRAANFSYAVSIMFCAMLVRDFLSSRERLPRADKFLWAVGWVAACGAAASLVLPKHISLIFLVPVIVSGSLVTGVLSIIAAKRGWEGARYFCAAWISFHLAALVAIATYLRLLPLPVNPPEIVACGNALEMILLSLALADRINGERKQKQRAQAHTLAILQASHVLSSETRLEELHASLCEVMARLTGASAVRFLLRDADLGAWFLYGAGGARQRLSLEEAGNTGLVAVNAFREIERTRAALSVKDALQDPRFAGDPALRGARACSLLGLPILHHGELTAVVLLEHRDRAGAFSETALGTLEAVAGPLAVSIENALLYEHMEQRVAEQTRVLRETQEQLVATARRAGMAEIATNVLHNVGNTLNSVNVAAELMRSQLTGSRLPGLEKAVDLLDAHAQDLGEFLKDDSKGRMVPRYLRDLHGALAGERQELLDHLGRLAISVEHIKQVVATQQSYAGPSVMTELVQPRELVENALHIAGESFRGQRVEVVRHVADLPELQLDKTRAVQILVNLLHNAVQAMHQTDSEQRKLTVRVDEWEGRLRFQVKDRGCGIPPENLTRIFSHGFTTRPDGHGFGLHSCALAAIEMGGQLKAESDGPGEGATFTLELPLTVARHELT